MACAARNRAPPKPAAARRRIASALRNASAAMLAKVSIIKKKPWKNLKKSKISRIFQVDRELASAATTASAAARVPNPRAASAAVAASAATPVVRITIHFSNRKNYTIDS